MSEDNSRFNVGENVRYASTGKIGTINKVIKGLRSYSYKVTIDGKVRTIPERFLEPVLDTEDRLIEDFVDGSFGDHNDFKLFQTWIRLSRPLESNLYSYLGSKTIFNPHQFKPLLRFLSPSSDERLFIADEVGVGKTIETGIILTELIARGRLDNNTPILIVCPNSLGPKWVKEMKERFRLNFHLHDGKSLKYTLEACLRDGVFPKNYLYSVVGLQLIRRENYLSLLEEIDAKKESPLFGMVIIDEAHHMRNPETDSNNLGNLLSNMTEMMLMLSATPLNLRSEDLYHQMHILNPVAFPDKTTFETLQSPVIKLNRIRNLISKNDQESRKEITYLLEEIKREPLGEVISSHPEVLKFVERLKNPTPFSAEEVVRFERLFISLSPLYYSFTRTRKREALEHQVHREVWELPIELSEREMEFHNDMLETIERYYLEKGGDPQAIGFVSNTHRRMISSCIPAMKEYLEWCIKENKMLVYDERKILEEAEDDSQLGAIEMDPDLKNEFLRLLEEVKELENYDSKYEQFKKMLEKILSNHETPQVIVFSFFVRTLKYLKRRLEKDGFKVGIIHGEVPLVGKRGEPGRYEIMDAFKKGEFDILLSSEVGGEGLDFQYCHAIINYDLPYNPMRVEQRIGRVDRFGQKADKIIVANLFIKNTVDEEIYDRLYRRIRLIEDGIGTLEPILGKEVSDIQSAIITGKLTEEQKAKLQRRLEEAIAAAKVEMEEFEKRRNELLGDDYLVEPINNISKGSFVSPEDAIQLTEQCIASWKECRFKRTGDGHGELSLSGEVLSKLESFLRRPGNEGGYGVLQTLLSSGGDKVKVVFDGSIAEDYPDHLFLSPTGYWTRFLTHQLEQEKKIQKVSSFDLSPDIGLPEGEYIVFLFEVRLEGIRTEIEFLGIPVNIKSKLVVEGSFEDLPRILSNAKAVDSKYIPKNLDRSQGVFTWGV
ncbi:MAG TPA: DNA/RNA helicase, superfamily II [Candidatus Omnitrophica bacterium]|nr:DNA/RNA helicase, superfamily II [Candidatus Omnitrophota bacterium]